MMRQILNYQVNPLQLAVLGLCSTALLCGGCSSSSTPEASSASSPVAAVESVSSQPAASGKSAAGDAKIDINNSSIAELDKLELPGTKPSLSERIQGAKPYKTPEDMVTKKAISAEEYKLIKDLVTVGKSK